MKIRLKFVVGFLIFMLVVILVVCLGKILNGINVVIMKGDIIIVFDFYD